jgi:hypothetical protein
MAFAFRRITSSRYQEISDNAAEFSAKVEALENYGTIQVIKAVNPLTREVTKAIAYKDPGRGNSLVVKYASSGAETDTGMIESISSTPSGTISGWVNTNFGDSGGGGGSPVFDVYIIYQYENPKEACELGVQEYIHPVVVYVYRDEVFSDSKGQRLFRGMRYWYYITNREGNPIGESWNIDDRGVITERFMCY